MELKFKFSNTHSLAGLAYAHSEFILDIFKAGQRTVTFIVEASKHNIIRTYYKLVT